jgi:hypothetical protein
MRTGFQIPKNRLYLFLCLTAVFLCTARYAWCSPLPVGSLEFIKGDVSIEREGRQSVLMLGGAVLVQDTLRTGADSSVELVFVDESWVRLAENTSLEIVEYRYDPVKKIRHVLVSLILGKARFAVRDFQEYGDKRFQVQTPVAVVGSRDTDFIVAYQGEAATDEVCRGGLVEALCLENSIVVFSNDFVDKPVVVISNMISRVCGSNLPTPPGFATPNENASILKGLEEMGNVMPPPSNSPRIIGGPPPGADQ